MSLGSVLLGRNQEGYLNKINSVDLPSPHPEHWLLRSKIGKYYPENKNENYQKLIKNAQNYLERIRAQDSEICMTAEVTHRQRMSFFHPVNLYCEMKVGTFTNNFNRNYLKYIERQRHIHVYISIIIAGITLTIPHISCCLPSVTRLYSHPINFYVISEINTKNIFPLTFQQELLWFIFVLSVVVVVVVFFCIFVLPYMNNNKKNLLGAPHVIYRD